MPGPPDDTSADFVCIATSVGCIIKCLCSIVFERFYVKYSNRAMRFKTFLGSELALLKKTSTSSLLSFSRVFLFLSRESDRSAITSSLRSCQPLVYHCSMGESR